MKNLSVVLNIVLVIAVGILYFLHFQGKGNVVAQSSDQTPKDLPVVSSSIVFVNSDSLLEQYEYYKSKKREFESAQEKIKQELKVQGERLQQEIELYQKQAIGMTDMEKMQKEEQLGMRQQQLMKRKDELLSNLDDEQAKTSEELYQRLSQYLRKYNADRNYSFVLGFQKGGGILFANDSLNITSQVIEGLNKEYLEQQK
jgi:outer membrane protein